NSYLEFCNIHHLDPDPSADMLSLFITFMSHHIQSRSIHVYLSGIVSQLKPYYPDVKKHRDSHFVVQTFQDCMRRFSSPLCHKAPLTHNHLLLATCTLPLPLSFDDLLFLSQLHIGFFTLLCLGELVIPDDRTLRNPFKCSLHHHASWLAEQLHFLLPHDKMNTRFEGNSIIVQSIGHCRSSTWEHYVHRHPTLLQALL
ncbi:hypothetical protein EV363DRAFT_1129040, partial [Boletus edulis]